MYSLEKKNSNSDYPKRQILLVQESFKVFVPVSAVLCLGLLALNIANIVCNFMAVYICVIINLIGVGIICGIVLSLVKGNIRQRNLFEQLEENIKSDNAEARILRYVSDTDGILKKASAVCITETDSDYIILPRLPEYKHKLFTRYDFRGDFGRLVLPKSEYAVTEEESGLRFVSANNEFEFAALNSVANNRA